MLGGCSGTPNAVTTNKNVKMEKLKSRLYRIEEDPKGIVFEHVLHGEEAPWGFREQTIPFLTKDYKNGLEVLSKWGLTGTKKYLGTQKDHIVQVRTDEFESYIFGTWLMSEEEAFRVKKEIQNDPLVYKVQQPSYRNPVLVEITKIDLNHDPVNTLSQVHEYIKEVFGDDEED